MTSPRMTPLIADVRKALMRGATLAVGPFGERWVLAVGRRPSLFLASQLSWISLCLAAPSAAGSCPPVLAISFDMTSDDARAVCDSHKITFGTLLRRRGPLPWGERRSPLPLRRLDHHLLEQRLRLAALGVAGHGAVLATPETSETEIGQTSVT